MEEYKKFSQKLEEYEKFSQELEEYKKFSQELQKYAKLSDKSIYSKKNQCIISKESPISQKSINFQKKPQILERIQKL